MDETAIGSSFESSLRILILLQQFSPQELNAKQIIDIDYISVYAADFGLMDENLHGNNAYRLSEYPARSKRFESVFNSLVLNGLILLHYSSSGFTYSISDSGRDIANSLSSEYAEEYRYAIESVKAAYTDYKQMSDDIIKLTMRSIEEVTNE